MCASMQTMLHGMKAIIDANAVMCMRMHALAHTHTHTDKHTHRDTHTQAIQCIHLLIGVGLLCFIGRAIHNEIHFIYR